MKGREYWMIYRGPNDLAVTWLASPPPLLLSASCLSSQSICVPSVVLTDGRGGRRWVEEPFHMTAIKPGPLWINQYSLVKYLLCFTFSNMTFIESQIYKKLTLINLVKLFHSYFSFCCSLFFFFFRRLLFCRVSSSMPCGGLLSNRRYISGWWWRADSSKTTTGGSSGSSVSPTSGGKGDVKLLKTVAVEFWE